MHSHKPESLGQSKKSKRESIPHAYICLIIVFKKNCTKPKSAHPQKYYMTFHQNCKRARQDQKKARQPSAQLYEHTLPAIHNFPAQETDRIQDAAKIPKLAPVGGAMRTARVQKIMWRLYKAKVPSNALIRAKCIAGVTIPCLRPKVRHHSSAKTHLSLNLKLLPAIVR
jgi:hypothetical protein